MVTNCQTTNEHIVHALRLFVCRSSHKVSTRSLWSLGRSMLARIIKNNHSPQHLPTSAPADSLRRLRSRYTFLARRSRHSSRPCPLVKGSFSPSGSTLPSPERGGAVAMQPHPRKLLPFSAFPFTRGRNPLSGLLIFHAFNTF